MTVASGGLNSKVTVEPVLFLYMLGIYLLYGVIQDLIYQKVCLENFGEEGCGDALQEPENEDKLHVVQTEASQWIQ